MNGLLQTLRGLGPVRLAMIGGVTVAMIAFFAFITTRIAQPGMALLYSDLELHDSGQIVQKLDAMGVPYQIKGDGTQLLVPADQVAKLRMTMAEAGLPHGGSIGYEIFDKSDALGTSSLVQNINQLRALEGELARTISSINSVQSARVHLVLPRREMFSREMQEPSAAIVIKMRGAERLAKSQVAAIQYLVASAVPSLKPTRVSIIDGDGNLLARGDGDTSEAALASSAEEQRVNYETRLSHNVEDLLERTVGPGKARVDVHADMDFDRITTNSKSFDPDRPGRALDPDGQRQQRQQRQQRPAGHGADQPAQRADRRRGQRQPQQDRAHRGNDQLRDRRDDAQPGARRPAWCGGSRSRFWSTASIPSPPTAPAPISHARPRS